MYINYRFVKNIKKNTRNDEVKVKTSLYLISKSPSARYNEINDLLYT